MSLTIFRDGNMKLAGALAVVAAVLTMIYVARGGGEAPARAASVATAPVYVATRDIPIGTTAARLFGGKYVALRDLPRDAVSAGAITDRRQLSGLVVTQPVYGGEQLTEHRFGPDGATGILADLRGTMRLVRLAGDQQQLLSGILKPGDRVDVLASSKDATGARTVATIALR